MKMDRLSAIRLAGVSGAAAFVGGKFLGDTVDAMAMNPRFNPVLRLTSNGRVMATGPTSFDANELQAMVFAHVAQGNKIQSGATIWFTQNRSTWYIILSGPPLVRGTADAYGLAYVENNDGSYEWYPWEMAVTLR